MPTAIAAHHLRVNRIDLIAGRQQHTNQQAPVGLNPDDDLGWILGMSSHQGMQRPHPGEAIGDTPGASTPPSWSTRHRSWWRSPQSTPTNNTAILLCSDLPSASQRRTCGALMAVLTGTTSHQPSALLNTSRGTVSPQSSKAPMPPSAHRLAAPP